MMREEVMKKETKKLRDLSEKELDAVDHVDEGIFAYVSKLRVDAPDPRCDVATEALTLLSWRVARTELSRLDSAPTA